MSDPRRDELDRRLMRRALALAAAADHRASPNPTVGAVLTTPEGVVVATGVSHPVGGPHAEVVALEAAGSAVAGATVYVTLEPCSHHGRTAPCADALVAAGVRRVVIATGDPDPRVNGRGIARLRTAGVQVDEDVCAEEGRRLHRFFLHWAATRRPFVTMKLATSLDGRVATATGDSRWVTSSASRHLGHRLRHRHDAIAVGVGTVLADDPLLTTRLPGEPDARSPLRVVMDSGLRTPASARLFDTAGPSRGTVLIATLDTAPSERARVLERAGAEVVRLPESHGRVDAAALLGVLGARSVSSLLLEGGPTLHGSFADACLVDGVVAFLAPRIVGGETAPAAVGGRGVKSLEAARHLVEVAVTRAGGDIVVTGYSSPKVQD